MKSCLTNKNSENPVLYIFANITSLENYNLCDVNVYDVCSKFSNFKQYKFMSTTFTYVKVFTAEELSNLQNTNLIYVHI